MESLKSNRDFRNVYEKGKFVADRLVVVHYFPNSLNLSRFGFSVSKKIGKSVTRNLVKRRLKEIVRGISPRIKPGYDIVISARKGAEAASFDILGKNVNQAVYRAFLFSKEDHGHFRGS